jgi:hypothetical protein
MVSGRVINAIEQPSKTSLKSSPLTVQLVADQATAALAGRALRKTLRAPGYPGVIEVVDVRRLAALDMWERWESAAAACYSH